MPYPIDKKKQEKYTKIILDFFKSRPAISVNYIEKKIANNAQFLSNAISTRRLIPEKYIFPTLCLLSKYGIKIDGYSCELDEDTNVLLCRKFVDNIETVEVDNSFEYIIKEDRVLYTDYLDLL